MKKLLVMFFAIVLPMHVCAVFFENNSSQSNCCLSRANCEQSGWLSQGWDVEGRVGAFRPSAKILRRIYSYWSPEYEIEVSKQIYNDVHAWSNVGWYSKHGHSLGLEDSTHIRILPISFGLKYRFCLTERASAYLGLGACYTILKVKDESPFVVRHTNKEGWGGVVKAGVRYAITCCTFVDFFVDYYYHRFHFHETSKIERHNMDVGGVKIGGGLGFYF